MASYKRDGCFALLCGLFVLVVGFYGFISGFFENGQPEHERQPTTDQDDEGLIEGQQDQASGGTNDDAERAESAESCRPEAGQWRGLVPLDEIEPLTI